MDAWINEPLPESSEESDGEKNDVQANLFIPVSQQAAIQEKLQKRYEPTEEELQKVGLLIILCTFQFVNNFRFRLRTRARPNRLAIRITSRAFLANRDQHLRRISI